MNNGLRLSLIEQVHTYGFENVLETLLTIELESTGNLTRTNWLHALNRRVNAWCFEKAIEPKKISDA